MSLTNAINASLSGMSKNQQEFAIIAQNVANADNSQYATLKLNAQPSFAGNNVTGVEVKTVAAQVDEILQTRLYERNSSYAYDKQIEDSWQQILMQFGSPRSDVGIDKKIVNLFKSLDDIALRPASPSLKQIGVINFTEVATSLSSFAGTLYQMQLDIDQAIGVAVNDVNRLLSNAYQIGLGINTLDEGSTERVAAEQEFRTVLEQISEYFSIYSYWDESGKPVVFTAQGDHLIGDLQYFLKYTPQQSTRSFIANESMNAIMVSAYSRDGRDLMINDPMVKAGKIGAVENRYNSGKIGAMLHIRDTIIPNALAQIDNLASNLKEGFNNAHNNGCGFPPSTILNGTKTVGHQDIVGFSGKARIAMVDDAGDAFAAIPPLDLDFDALDTGLGAGRANLHGIMQEIQYHFGNRISADKSISLGNLSDIKLASCSKNIAPSSTFNLDLELTNSSQTQSTVQILGVTAQDMLGNNILSSFSSASFTAEVSSIVRTTTSGPSIALNLPASINYPFTIDMQVQVNDGSTTSSATLRYIINNPVIDPINKSMNTRFSVDSKVSALDPGTINSPPMGFAPLSVSLVDESGNAVGTGSQDQGFLRLSSSYGNYRIAIDNLTSAQTGDALTNTLPTNDSFSYFFGLNDIFVRTDSVENWNSSRNTALYLGVRSDITQNSALLSSGKLQQTTNYQVPGSVTFQYHLDQSDSSIIQEMQDLSSASMFFSAAGGLAAVNTSISNYTASFMGFCANMHEFAISKKDQSQLLQTAIFEKVQGIRGVDVNQEMANMIIYQQSFGASAKTIQVVKEMMDTMLAIFN